MGWIGVDLDGTLAYYLEWKSPYFIGDPIPAMVARVKEWLAKGKEVKIVTARAADPQCVELIKLWLVQKCGLPELEVTDKKDYKMIELWDDRCVQVVPNGGVSYVAELKEDLQHIIFWMNQDTISISRFDFDQGLKQQITDMLIKLNRRSGIE